MGSKKKAVLPIEDLEPALRNMVRLALRAKKRAYAPYSRYRVGAAVMDTRGKLHTGCNVENASYPAGICAERTAIAKMVSRGGKEIRLIVVAASSEEPVFPCGMCLQVIREFAKDARVIALNGEGTLFQEETLSQLFPFAFSPEKLGL